MFSFTIGWTLRHKLHHRELWRNYSAPRPASHPAMCGIYHNRVFTPMRHFTPLTHSLLMNTTSMCFILLGGQVLHKRRCPPEQRPRPRTSSPSQGEAWLPPIPPIHLPTTLGSRGQVARARPIEAGTGVLVGEAAGTGLIVLLQLISAYYSTYLQFCTYIHAHLCVAKHLAYPGC